MAFSLMNGLSSLGAGVQQFAATAGLEAQKADLAKQNIMLADQLATTRESAGRQEAGQIAAAAQEKQNTFIGGQGDLNRQTQLTTAQTSAGATLGAASLSAGASKYVADVSANKPTGELQMARALAGPNATQEQLQDALVTVLSGKAKYQSSPAVQPDPDDPTKMISGVNVFNTRTGETEFRRTDTNPNKPGAGSQGNRAEVQTNRVVAAGNAATKAVENIMELPATTSTGWFAGAGQGTGLLAAAKNVLANTATSQDVQSFKVMATGIGRNMATLETQGLAPPQGFTHSMESTMLAEGDTQETKLRKMAEMRQIIEANLEPSLSNDKVSASQKALIGQIIQKVQTAIPFTQHDITMLSQAKNPATTMADVMKAKGLGGGAMPPASPSPKPPAIGEVQQGYSFTGGDPANPASWKAVQ